MDLNMAPELSAYSRVELQIKFDVDVASELVLEVDGKRYILKLDQSQICTEVLYCTKQAASSRFKDSEIIGLFIYRKSLQQLGMYTGVYMLDISF